MYIISYSNPQGETSLVRIQDKDGENFLKTYNLAKSTDLVTIPGKNTMVQKRHISGVEHRFDDQDGFKKIENTKEEKTAWETKPPTKKQIQALQLGVLFLNPYPVMFQMNTALFMGIVMSVWNWQSEKTKEIFEIGKELIEDRVTMKSLINDIKLQYSKK